jgi:ribosomal protein S6
MHRPPSNLKRTWGDRELAYEIDKESRGRYRLFNIDLEQEKLPKIEDALRLRGEILRYLFVVKGE